jgi:hypothetical protein
MTTKIAFGALLSLTVALCPALAQDAAKPGIPNFSAMTSAWLAMGTDFRQVPGAPPMVTNDEAHPHFGNQQGRQSSFRFADLNNPNLTDFAKQSLKKTNDEVLRGKAVFSREARCWPTGVPTYDLNQAQPVYFIQTPKEVVMIWQMDHQVRHIYLDVPHSKSPKPSWYGESVGRFEGDTLVVDTIGQNTETFVDNYRTPHSDKLHVVERFHLTNGGKNLQADITVDDPATFKQPLKVVQTWRQVNPGAMTESSCAESGPGFFAFDVEPIPTAVKPDF